MPSMDLAKKKKVLLALLTSTTELVWGPRTISSLLGFIVKAATSYLFFLLWWHLDLFGSHSFPGFLQSHVGRVRAPSRPSVPQYPDCPLPGMGKDGGECEAGWRHTVNCVPKLERVHFLLLHPRFENSQAKPSDRPRSGWRGRAPWPEAGGAL